jgi:hypothetical protein
MDHTPVASSVIASIGYDAAEKTLEVTFHSGRTYQYLGVPAYTHQSLLAADSIGRYFNKRIRDKYPQKELGSRQQ